MEGTAVLECSHLVLIGTFTRLAISLLLLLINLIKLTIHNKLVQN